MINIDPNENEFIVPFIEQNNGQTGNTVDDIELYYNNNLIVTIESTGITETGKYLQVETDIDAIPYGNGTYKITLTNNSQTPDLQQHIKGVWVKKQIITEPSFINITYGNG